MFRVSGKAYVVGDFPVDGLTYQVRLACKDNAFETCRSPAAPTRPLPNKRAALLATHAEERLNIDLLTSSRQDQYVRPRTGQTQPSQARGSAKGVLMQVETRTAFRDPRQIGTPSARQTTRRRRDACDRRYQEEVRTLSIQRWAWLEHADTATLWPPPAQWAMMNPDICIASEQSADSPPLLSCPWRPAVADLRQGPNDPGVLTMDELAIGAGQERTLVVEEVTVLRRFDVKGTLTLTLPDGSTRERSRST